MRAVFIQKEGTMSAVMEDNTIMLKGGGPDAAKILRALERPVEWPVAPPEVWGEAVQPDYVTRSPANDFELMQRALHVAEDFGIMIKILED